MIKSEVEAKETNRKIKIEVDNRIKREKKKDKAIDPIILTNDSPNNDFADQNDFSDIDFESINPVHSKIENDSCDSDLTDLDDLADIDSIIDELIKTLQP